MYHHIKGRLVEVTPSQAIVEAGGVGYELNISQATHRALPQAGGECLLYAHFSVREDAQTLYGFISQSERSLFRALVSIKGIGPATAMQILSGASPNELIAAVRDGDMGALKKIKGIGAKTAGRIILELQGAPALNALAGCVGGQAPVGGLAASAAKALEALGINPREAAARVEKVRSQNPALSLEETIRAALQ